MYMFEEGFSAIFCYYCYNGATTNKNYTIMTYVFNTRK